LSFPAATLALFDRAREVDIETRSEKGAKHSVPIWVVVDGGEVFVRTYRGKNSRWYRELLARSGAVVADGKRVSVRAERAVEAEAIRRTSDGYRKKYGKSGSLDAMLRRAVLETTLRLEPA
jgi:hypothetical protein